MRGDSDGELLADDRRKLLDWGSGGGPEPPAVPVHLQVEEQIRATPEALAVADGARRLTYRELDAAAGRLAARLHRAGVVRGHMVGVVLARSLELTVAQVAILRVGATIVPLDPANPPARLAGMLGQAHPGVVLTGHAQAGRIPAMSARVLVLDAPHDDTAHDDTAHEDTAHDDGAADAEPAPGPVAVDPDELAYVTYTSGSTGTPKGVMMSHRSLAATVAWARRVMALTAADRAGMTASPGFDVSVLDTFAALTSGASLHAPDGALLTSPGDLRRWLLSERITVTFLPTPLGEAMLAMAWPAVGSPRLLHIGGAVLHQHPAPALPFEVLNLYGLTEVGVWSTCAHVEPGGTGLPPVGRPIDNAVVLVLDERLEPVPIGEPGEVYLGGVGVARGYLGRPGPTAERFVPNPMGRGDRLYRSGDLARWRSDGQLDFIGRTDHQVQSSGGVRVELGEVEAALVAHPAVTQAVVTVVDGRLVGYVAGDRAVDPATLRDHVAERLPGYMVPSQYVVLDHFPLTATGKIDRRALPPPPAPPEPPAQSSVPYEAPRTDLERQLLGVWQEVLGARRVGIHDSFFDVGGTSMSLVQVYGRLTQIASREISLVELYEHPTIAAFATHLDGGLTGDPADRRAEPGDGAELTEQRQPDRARLARLRRDRVQEGRASD